MEAAQNDPAMDPLLAEEPKSPNTPDPRATNHLDTHNEDYQISGEKAPGSLTGQLDSVHPLLDGYSKPSKEREADGIAQHSAETDPQPPQSNVPLSRYPSRRRPVRKSTRGDHREIARANVSRSHLKPVIKPLVCLLGACVLAVGHHLFNSWADGLPIDSGTRIPQVWVLRIGTGFAFAFQTVLAASLSFVICQLLWFSARRKYLTVQDLNKLYHVERRDIISTIWSNAVMHGPLLVGAALLSFMLPIAAVFTPGSLGVRTAVDPEDAPCVIFAGNLSDLSATPPLYTGDDCLPLDIIPNATRISEVTFAGARPIPLPEFCGKNCTYKVITDSMSFKCDTNQPLPAGQMPSGVTGTDTVTSIHAPSSRTFWNATPSGDQLQIANDPTLPFSVGWLSGTSSSPNGDTQKAYCTPVHARYEFSVQTISGTQSVTYNVTTSDEIPHVPPLSGQPARWCGIKEPQIAAITLAARRSLQGYLSMRTTEYGNTWDLSSTVRLASFLNTVSDDLVEWGDVVKGIEETAANLTASLLSMDNGRQNSTCTYLNSRVVYDYKSANLLAPYGVAILVVAASLVFGVFVFLRFNPHDLTTSFVDTIGITRNPDMEIFARKDGGQNELEALLRSTKFRLGELSGGYMGYGTRKD
ncbi:hypothetical protein FRC04_004535 [Tulasnella sp. 424]|nr:hypothetical protein FRC04_004535 [Tulasnella sp. 424]KAG8976605.1 hypothetical protein FRC05_003444 [Tulasnella sp. 425]